MENLLKWHKRTGITVSLVLVFLVFTGIFLQHSNDLSLDKSYLASQQLLKIYGIESQSVTAFKTKNHWVSFANGSTYLDKQFLDYVDAIELTGAVEVKGKIILASASEIYITESNGRLIDELYITDYVTDAIQGLSMNNKGEVIIFGSNENWLLNKDFLKISKYKDSPAKVVSAKNIDDDLESYIQEDSVKRIITWERFMQDLHSGRFFGQVGVYFIDIISVLLLILAITGIVLWSRSSS